MSFDDEAPSGDRIIVDGPRRGDIAADWVEIRRMGSVVGNIVARVVRVGGRLEGDVTSEEFYASKTARIRGVIRSDIIGIMPGAALAGCAFDTSRPSVEIGRELAPPAETPLREADQATFAPPVPAEAARDVPDPVDDPVRNDPAIRDALSALAGSLSGVVAASRRPRGAAGDGDDLPAGTPFQPVQAQRRVLPSLFS